jgi:phosphoribosylaminoimidazolecarboxamide formyltransferase / IMP cyclohydrolase
MTDLVPIGRALISVSDKAGLIEFARALAALGVELISTGGTALTLRAAGLKVRDVSEVTGFPEMMDGRVKTLHPMVHGGLLALRDDDEHLVAMAAHGIEPIDLLVVNLYPFEATVAKGAGYDDCIENIDIGGPAMIRAAAKNHKFVTVVTDPQDYAGPAGRDEGHMGATRLAFRSASGADRLCRTAAYDAAVSTWMAGAIGEADAAPPRLCRNAGAGAALWRKPASGCGLLYRRVEPPRRCHRAAVAGQGTELQQHQRHRCRVRTGGRTLHRPPGLRDRQARQPLRRGHGGTLAEAYARAFDCDRTSAFGGIIALNGVLDGPTAEAIGRSSPKSSSPPDADADAKAVFAAKKNLRLLTTGALPDAAQAGWRSGRWRAGFWCRTATMAPAGPADLKVVTKRAPTAPNWPTCCLPGRWPSM